MKTSRHFQDPPKSNPPREAPRPPRRGPESSQNRFGGDPPQLGHSCLKPNQNPYRVLFIEDIQAFPGPPQKQPPQRGPKSPPRRGPESSQNRFSGDPTQLGHSCLKSNQNPYRVLFIEDIQAFPGPPARTFAERSRNVRGDFSAHTSISKTPQKHPGPFLFEI